MTESPTLIDLLYEVISAEENGERLCFKLFIEKVLRLNMTAEELDSAEIHKSYWANVPESKRKMDLAILTKYRFIPIKVNMVNGLERQCREYLQQAKSYTAKHSLKHSPLTAYITPSGYFPEPRKTTDLKYDKLEIISLRSEILQWIEACLKQMPETVPCKQRLKSLQKEVRELIGKTEPQLEKLMFKFFTALDECFDENFCKEYRLKRGGDRRGEVGNFENYKREIRKFYGTGFSVSGIALLCTNAAGKVTKFAPKKELWFLVECYNGGENWIDIPKTLCAGFIIFDYAQNDCLYEKPSIEKILNEKNILPKDFIKDYREKFAGVVGRTDLHDAHGNTIDFKNVDKTLKQFRTQEDIDSAVENVKTEIESLLRRFVYG